MRRRVTAIALVAPLLGVAADAPAADTAIPAEAQAWLSSGSDARVENDAWGDLSGHGTRDWAGLVDVSMPNDEERYHLRVVSFMQRPDSRYRLAAQSATQREDCGTSDCRLDEIRIAKQSLFVGWRALARLQRYGHLPVQGEGWPLAAHRSRHSIDRGSLGHR